MDLIADIVLAPIHCIGWIIAGGIAGALAHTIMKTNQPFITDIIVGLIGAFIGGILVSVLDINRPDGGIGGFLASIVIAAVGAVIFLGILRALRRS